MCTNSSPQLTRGSSSFFSQTSSTTTTSSYSSSSSSSSLSSQQRQQKQRRQKQHRTWMKYAWAVHFASCLIVMVIGTWNNYYARKYIPIIGSENLKNIDCGRAFLNVMAPSQDDPGSIVCCESTDKGNWEAQDGGGGGGILDICPSESSILPLAGRLGRFPEAWLLPLFPLLLRLLFTLYQLQCHSYPRTSTSPILIVDKISASSPSSSATSPSSTILVMPLLRRLGFYVVLLNVRGWILYVAFNKVEDSIVQPIDETCWYRDWLRIDQPDCLGRVFDFSDHIVLYFAQILPIALVEFLHAWEHPYWTTERSPQNSRVDQFLSALVPITLVGGLLYLYLVTSLGVYKTAYYFHTGPEVAAGWLVSLLVQIPLCCMQCSEHCADLREFLFAEGRKPRLKLPFR